MFDLETNINTDLIIRKSGCDDACLKQVLKKMEQKQLISYRIISNDSNITFNEVREDELTINRVAKFLEKQNNIKSAQFDSIVDYLTNTDTCKSRLILNYFGEEQKGYCGICSWCITKNKAKKAPANTAHEIISELQREPYSSRELEEKLKLSSKEILYALQLLLENEKIKINKNNKYSLI